MLAEWIAIVNLKNKLLSRNRMYEENRNLAFDMRTAGRAAATANHADAIFVIWLGSHMQPCSSGIGTGHPSLSTGFDL
jgi:hypothetical protein